MKWIGQNVYDFISRFRNDVYLESISTGTIASGAHLGLDSNNKIVKAVGSSGDLTSIVAGTGLSGTSLTGPIPTINIDAAQPTVTSLGTLTALQVDNINLDGGTITNSSGNLTIVNTVDDADIIFQSDDGSGGVETYLLLDGSGSRAIVPTNKLLGIGNFSDMYFKHNGTNSEIVAQNGDLYIKNTADDKDIIFQSDDGSGGTTAYLTLDGGLGYMVAKKGIKHEGFLWFLDNKTIYVGSGNDLRIHHNGSDSYISQEGTGSLIIRTTTNDEDVIFQCDDGSGGTATYLTLDGSAATVEVAKEMNLAVPLATDQQKHVMHYDFQGYASGDGTNYEMANNLSDTNAPFEHNISLGADGTTATTIQNIIRSGGKVMPRACTLTRWTGWAAAAGSATAYVALFKVTPTRNSNTDLSAVLLDEFSYTALGNAKMEDFDETSFTATAIAAGDILITAMKSESGAVHYFTSTVEIEF